MKNDVKPVYLKLRDVIAAAILDGNYKEGQMLPSVRAFAADQGANPLTVAKAYQLFQDSGLVDVKRALPRDKAPGPARCCPLSPSLSYLIVITVVTVIYHSVIPL
jgi:GntR family transcriptional regulator